MPHTLPAARSDPALPIHKQCHFSWAHHPRNLAGSFWSSSLFSGPSPEAAGLWHHKPQELSPSQHKTAVCQTPSTLSLLHCTSQPELGPHHCLTCFFSSSLINRGMLAWLKTTFKEYINNSPLATPVLAFQESHQRYPIHWLASRHSCSPELWAVIASSLSTAVNISSQQNPPQ